MMLTLIIGFMLLFLIVFMAATSYSLYLCMKEFDEIKERLDRLEKGGRHD